ncbi:hypothetical protein NPIL_108801 [Nephila pilipes]|uniref:Uncharacterized protein n=1 Tax=Nephila pilipes TaxID=299642 RepID=A0A8X6UEQ9_NEPPI|nr:hypothetical protein NPIL_108801 [Nephila pilipes]
MLIYIEFQESKENCFELVASMHPKILGYVICCIPVSSGYVHDADKQNDDWLAAKERSEIWSISTVVFLLFETKMIHLGKCHNLDDFLHQNLNSILNRVKSSSEKKLQLLSVDLAPSFPSIIPLPCLPRTLLIQGWPKMRGAILFLIATIPAIDKTEYPSSLTEPIRVNDPVSSGRHPFVNRSVNDLAPDVCIRQPFPNRWDGPSSLHPE